ncbi:glycosyltransferase family 4 protein [Candidatus Uhrbacteria bacterium]|nr:glycosyltransferase family 4 protein [Candidatus Uhrbacteria bacterium]
MTIAIDLRPLHEGYGGVAEYTRNIVKALLRNDRVNEYVLFSNSLHGQKPALQISHPRAVHAHFRIPSKFLNARIRFLDNPQLDRMIEQKCGKHIDLFFAPNCDFFSLGKKVKKVVTLHDLSFEIYPEFLSGRSRRWHALVNPRTIALNVDHIITVSEHTRHTVLSQFDVNENRVTSIPLGVDAPLPREQHRSIAGLPENYILCWGSTEGRKNIPHTLRAFGRLQRRLDMRNFSCVIAGACEGAERQKMIRVIHEYGIEEHCFFSGLVSSEERAYLYAHARALVYPSFYEGFGLPPLEAASYGIPVIVSRSSALTEIMGDSALSVDPYNEEELMQALMFILQNDRVREHYRTHGSQIASTYTWDRAARQTLDVFNSVTKQP